MSGFKLLREKEATDKPGKTAIALIERVDIAKQIVCSSRAYEEVNRIVFNEIQNGLHCCLNSAFRQKALMDLLLCSICDRDRVLAENLTVGCIVRIFLDNFPQHKVIIDVSYILTGVEFDGGVLHQHGVLHDEAVKTPVALFSLIFSKTSEISRRELLTPSISLVRMISSTKQRVVN